MSVIDCNLTQFLEVIRKEDKKILCFGTARMAKEALEVDEIAGRVECFLDNNPEKQGKTLRWKGRNYPVESPEILKKIPDAGYVLLIATSHFSEVCMQIESMQGITDIHCYIYPLLRIRYMPESEEFFQARILKPCLKEYGIVLDNQGIKGETKERLLKEKEAYIRGENPDNRPLVLPRIMVMPTTRCSLKCRDCSSLLPYFEHPADISMEQIRKDLDLFLANIDECMRITIGGEPFLYPALPELLAYLLEQPKLLGILMITNSTILPNAQVIEYLKDPKIFVEISDYGHLEKMSRIVSLFEKSQVRFKVLTEQVWTDMGGTQDRGREEAELRDIYLNCDQGMMVKAVHNGKFHICGRSSRMYALGKYTSARDYIDLDVQAPKGSLREGIRRLYYSDCADACNHCDLGAFPGKPIEAGIQLDHRFDKSAYTIVKRTEYEHLKFMAEIKEG